MPADGDTRKRGAARRKPTGGGGPRKSGDVHVTLDEDLAARLRSYAGYTGRTMSHIVGDMVREHLRNYRAHEVGTAAAEAPPRPAGEGPASALKIA